MQDIRDRWNEHVAPSVHARVWPTWPRLDQNQTFDQGKADIDWLLAEIGKLEAAASREGGSRPDAEQWATDLESAAQAVADTPEVLSLRSSKPIVRLSPEQARAIAAALRSRERAAALPPTDTATEAAIVGIGACASVLADSQRLPIEVKDVRLLLAEIARLRAAAPQQEERTPK